MAVSSALCLAAGVASAQQYRILDGSFLDAESGEGVTLSGSFSLGEQVPETAAFLIDDFEIALGDEAFLPAPPPEYLGLGPSLIVGPANTIVFDGDVVSVFSVRAGGELVAIDGDEVTFRYFDFATSHAGFDPGTPGGAESEPAEGVFAQATLVQVDQRFRVSEGVCPPEIVPPAGPPPGGGGGGIITASPEETPVAPTLEELNLSAPAGASVRFEDGVLTIETDGDLASTGPIPDLPGLVRVVIVAGGIVEGEFQLPPGVDVEINGGGEDGGDGEEGGGVIVPPPPSCDRIFFRGLIPILPAERSELGEFRFEATSAQSVEIDVQPRSPFNLIRLGIRRPVVIGLFSSDELDVRDIDVESIRVGPGEAAPLMRKRRTLFRFIEVEREGGRVQALFTAVGRRALGLDVADTELCLEAETTDGRVITGCDDIRVFSSPFARWWNRWRRSE